jgi:hypothetical protein
MGLVYDDKSPRPVYYAYQNLISQTRGLSYANMVNLGEGIQTHEFSSNKTKLLIIWTEIDELRTIEIPQTNFQSAYDRDSNPIQVSGDFEITIGFAPVYLVYSR